MLLIEYHNIGVLTEQFHLRINLRNNIIKYRKIKFNVCDGKLFTINENGPKLMSDYLKLSLDSRVSEIQYTIDLEGLPVEVFENISLGKYFY